MRSTARDRGMAGALLFAGSAVFLLSMLVGELLYPGYSSANNTISDLGVGPWPSNVIFNVAVFAFGLLSLAAAFLLQRSGADRTLTAILAVAGAGTMGVGLFNTDTGAYHFIAAFLAFAGAALASMLSFRIVGRPLGHVGTVLGAVSLIALVLFGAEAYLGLGKGGMERMILYPVLIWMIAVGGILMRDWTVTAPVR